MYYQIASILLAILGLIVLLSPESLFPKDTNNNILQKIHEYHQIVGGILVAIAYYIYTQSDTSDFQSTNVSNISETETTSVMSPPTYDEATS